MGRWPDLVKNELFWRIMKPLAPISDPVDDDWRLHATARLAEDWANPWTGQLVPKGSRLTVSSVIQLTKKKQLTIPLPNASALLLNSSANAFAVARAIRNSSNIDNPVRSEVAFNSDKEAFDYRNLSMTLRHLPCEFSVARFSSLPPLAC